MTSLYRGGLLFDGDGTLHEGMGLLVNGEKIEAVAPLGDFDGFAGETIDTSGGTILPGLFDCHVHLVYGGDADPFQRMTGMSDAEIALFALHNAQESLAGGITSLRDCGGKDYLEFAVRDACNRGIFRGPTIAAAGRMICMTGGHGNRIGRIADGIDEVVKAVREQVHAGSDLVKIMATGGVMTPGVNPEDAHYSPEEMAAGIAEGHRFRKPCASHAQGRDGILNAVRGGIDSIEHGIFMDERCVAEMIERGTYLVPTIAALKNILANADKGIPAYVLEKTRRVAAHHLNAVRMFSAAGGRIAMGTDAGTPFNHHGANAMEIAYMVEYGVSPADALVAATGNAADLNRMSDRGRLRTGFSADLLVVEGNPLEDIMAAALTANHRLVVKNGVPVADRRAGERAPRAPAAIAAA